jgi:hypothetical protein
MKKLMVFLLLCFSLNIFSYDFSDISIDLPENFKVTEQPPEQLIFENPEGRIVGCIYISKEDESIPTEILYTELKTLFKEITYSQMEIDENWFVLTGIMEDEEDNLEMIGHLKCLHEDGGSTPRMLLVFTPLDETEDEKYLVESLTESFILNANKFWATRK